MIIGITVAGLIFIVLGSMVIFQKWRKRNKAAIITANGEPIAGLEGVVDPWDFKQYPIQNAGQVQIEDHRPINSPDGTAQQILNDSQVGMVIETLLHALRDREDTGTNNPMPNNIEREHLVVRESPISTSTSLPPYLE